MNHVIINKTYTVELLVNGGSTSQRVYFPILQVLDRKLTQSIETFNVSVVPVSPSNVALAAAQLMNVAFLNLVVGDTEQITMLPLKKLININDNTAGTAFNPFAYEFDNLPIIWAKSYVFIADVTKIAVTNAVFLFNIAYTDYKK
jgi:hypothetical protein